MAAYSKVIHNTCYEVGHTWTPHCFESMIYIGKHALKESFLIYAPLYVITGIFRRKDSNYFKKKIWRDILQSTLFLGSNAFLFIGSFCFWRALTGMYFFFNVFVCGIPSGALAMLLERKDRRGMLALYVMNLAIETLYRMGEYRGIVTPLKHGEVLLFSFVTAIYLYLYRIKPHGNDGTRPAIQFIVGPSEAGKTDLPGASLPVRKLTLVDYLINLHPALMAAAASWRATARHHLCQHPHGCVAVALESGVRLFILGYGIQAVIKLIGALRLVVRCKRALLNAILHPENLAFAKFVASFGLIFQAVSCALRWCRDTDEPLHGLLAGFMAGSSMIFYKSSSIALYLASKLSEVLWFKGVSHGVLPLVKCADIIIYTISTSILFHAAVFEPHAIRPAYWKFLLRLTDNKFATMNRILLDCFGTKASRKYPDFWPKYDPQYTKLPLTKPNV